MNDLSDVDLAYIAGFLDGEGSITIHENCKPSPRGLNPNHTMQVSIGNTDPRVIEWIHSKFGGSLCRRKQRPGHKPVLQWIIRAAMALPFLELIRPFVRMKCDQIDLAIEFQRSKKMAGPRKITVEKVNWRESQRVRLRELNARSLMQPTL